MYPVAPAKAPGGLTSVLGPHAHLQGNQHGQARVRNPPTCGGMESSSPNHVDVGRVGTCHSQAPTLSAF